MKLMPDVTTKRCPKCGQRTTNLQLEECPYCQVPLVAEGEAQTAGVTEEQTRAVARQLVGSWKLWAAVIVLVAAATWGAVAISQRVMDLRSKDYLRTFDEKANQQLATASGEISKQVSKKIDSELKQSRVQKAIDDAAGERVNEALSNSLRPSLQEFQASMNAANRQLAKSEDALARLEKEIKAAQQKAAQLEAQLAQPAPAPVVASAAPAAATPGTNGATTTSNTNAKLTMQSQTLSANGPNYILTVFFNKTPSQPIGPVNLDVGTLQSSGAKIVAFGMLSQEPSQPAVITATKDAAELSFTVTGGDAPIVAMEVTGPTIVQMSSDALAQNLMLPIAADKLALPSAPK
jgi:hypothetical protein